MSALADQLVNWANSAQNLAWSYFKEVKLRPAKYGLTPADVAHWTYPGQRALIHDRERLQVSEPLKTSLVCAINGAFSAYLGRGVGLDTIRVIRGWVNSDRNGFPDPSGIDEAPVPPAPIGLSMVYVGAFGDRPLSDLPRQ